MAIKLEKLVKTYYDKLEEGKVMGRKCPVCGNVERPPVYACNACGSYETEWYEMSGKGSIVELYMTTAMSAKAAYKPYEPYAYAWVKAEEGPERNVMIRNITKQNEAYVRAHLPYPCHTEIVQCDGYKTCVFAIDPVDGEGNPIEIEKKAAAPAKKEEAAAPAEQAEAPTQPGVCKAKPETVAALINLVAESYKVDPATLSADTTFEMDLKAPSVIFVGFCAKIEDEFDVMVTITDASAAKTIGGVAELVDKLVEEG
ncbi:MAG: phosphopantetheine-binding protein [Lachnospiraceae bacterium]|nr:phosphopantetheine-binding protein [Lachnospiraceae bacterium]